MRFWTLSARRGRGLIELDRRVNLESSDVNSQRIGHREGGVLVSPSYDISLTSPDLDSKFDAV